MIRASGYYTAYIFSDGRGRERRIEAWDEDGHAMVLGPAGQLVRATSVPGFSEIVEYEEHYAAVLPGAGWKIKQRETVTPVIGWAVLPGGFTRPIALSDDLGQPGERDPYAEVIIDKRALLIAPDGSEPAESQEKQKTVP